MTFVTPKASSEARTCAGNHQNRVMNHAPAHVILCKRAARALSKDLRRTSRAWPSAADESTRVLNLRSFNFGRLQRPCVQDDEAGKGTSEGVPI